MRWYVNDASLQGQFGDINLFAQVVRSLIAVRARFPDIHRNLWLTRSFPNALVNPATQVRRALFEMRDRDLHAATLNWLDRTGPFVEDDRLPEADDFFEYLCSDVTGSGLGEAARRTKAGEECGTFSFTGGCTDFAITPLEVDHGLREERYGRYLVPNVWCAEALAEQTMAVAPEIGSWATLVAGARARFPNLDVSDLHLNPALAREPFQACLRDRALELMQILDRYVANRREDGAEGEEARHIVEKFFTGDPALFSGESKTNREQFASEMTFRDINGADHFAHWHGKIRHRHFRLHFEWPLRKGRSKLQIFYLGPKITKS